MDDAAIRQAEELEVSFYSGRSVSASLKGKDEETGLAILSVALEDIPEDIRKMSDRRRWEAPAVVYRLYR